MATTDRLNSSGSSLSMSKQMSARSNPFSDSGAIELRSSADTGHDAPSDAANSKGLPIRQRLTYLILYRLVLLAPILAGIELLIAQSHKLSSTGSPHGIFTYPGTDISRLPSSQFFVYKYLPVLITVIYGWTWRLIHDTLVQQESFVKLYHAEGAEGRESICLDYGHQWANSAVLLALKRKHWTVAVSASLLIITTNIIPTFACGFFATTFLQGEGRTVVAVSNAYGRMTEAMFAVVGVHATLLLVLLNWNGGRTKNVPIYLGSIDSLSRLMVDASPEVRADFQGLENVSNDIIDEKIGSKRYKIVVTGSQHQLVRISPETRVTSYTQTSSSKGMPHILAFPYNWILPVSYTLLAVLVICFSAKKYDNFLGDQPIYITTLAAFVRQEWYAFYMTYQTMEPWYQLSHNDTNGAPASSTVLLHQTGIRSWFRYVTSSSGVLPRFVFAASILGEFLLVTTSGFASDVVPASPRFIAPFVTSSIIILLMIGVTTAMALSRGGINSYSRFICRFRDEGFAKLREVALEGYIPHKPTSPAAVMAYVYASGDLMREGGDGRYRFGKFEGTDGTWRVGVHIVGKGGV